MVRTWVRAAVATAMMSALAGCVHHHRVPRGGETITYRADHAICLSCANFAVILGPDGQGILTRRVAGVDQPDQRFRATPAQARAFADALRRYRPKGELLIDWPDRANGRCPGYGTDGYRFDVRWQTALGPMAHLALDSGCDPHRTAAMATALDAAPRALPIGDLLAGH